MMHPSVDHTQQKPMDLISQCPGRENPWVAKVRIVSGGLVACLLALAFISSVAADERRVRDGNDARGPLDVAWVKHGHRTNADGVRQLVHTVRLYERWSVQRLRHRGFVNLFFDLRGNEGWRPERAAYITYHDGRLRAELVNFAADPPQFMRVIPMWRPNPKTVKIAFRKSALRRRGFSYYKWNLVSFVDEGHPSCEESGGCSDNIPNRGWLRHDL